MIEVEALIISGEGRDIKMYNINVPELFHQDW